MQFANNEYKHAALMAAIVAVVPLIFYPNNLGLKFNVAPALFFLFELIYYWAVFAVYLKGASTRNIFIAGMACFFVRLGVGVVFSLMVLMMHASGFKAAFAAGLYQYKPAMFLQVISFPFILVNIVKAYFAANDKSKSKLVMHGIEELEETKPDRPIIKKDTYEDRKIIGLKAIVDEKPFLGFDEALKYVGELSAVRFAVLIDRSGLPVSFFGQNNSLRNLWSAIGIYLIDKINEPLKRAGEFDLEGVELTLNMYRIHLVQIDSLYLLVAAEKDSGETEKVRINQVANMIRKIYHERYNTKPGKEAREDNYVPSFS